MARVTVSAGIPLTPCGPKDYIKTVVLLVKGGSKQTLHTRLIVGAARSPAARQGKAIFGFSRPYRFAFRITEEGIPQPSQAVMNTTDRIALRCDTENRKNSKTV
jgi:hypothetical protein